MPTTEAGVVRARRQKDWLTHMSLRSRARALQQATGLTYQQALERIRALGRAPAELARKTGWPLKVCDRFLVEGPKRSAGIPLPVPRSNVTPALSKVCEELRAVTSARAVCVLGARGEWLAMAGFQALMLLALPRPFRGGGGEVESVALDSKQGIHVVSRKLDAGARVYVLFEDERMLGVVRLKALAAARELNRILAEDIIFRPPGGGDSGSGAPEQISAYDGLRDRNGKLRSN